MDPVSLWQGEEGEWRYDFLDGRPSGLVYGEGRFVRATSGEIRSSVDGEDWAVAIEADAPFAAMAWGDGLFVAVTADALYTSEDGVTWTEQPSWRDPS